MILGHFIMKFFVHKAFEKQWKMKLKEAKEKSLGNI